MISSAAQKVPEIGCLRLFAYAILIFAPAND
jgi:hypothetical protein